VTDDELWILSFYRTSEISGALFFGRLAKSLRPSEIQHDLSKHFADEAHFTKEGHQLAAKVLLDAITPLIDEPGKRP